jgi:hypothetical protein
VAANAVKTMFFIFLPMIHSPCFKLGIEKDAQATATWPFMLLSFLTTLNYFPGDRESWGFPEQNPVPFEPRLQKQRSEHPLT